MWTAEPGARGRSRYEQKAWAGHTSRKSLASTTMIWTGLVMLVFVVVHLRSSSTAPWYQIGDPPVRDLYRTEVEVFSSPVWVARLRGLHVLVGLHLRHGISSAFQSLGAEPSRSTRSGCVVGRHRSSRS